MHDMPTRPQAHPVRRSSSPVAEPRLRVVEALPAALAQVPAAATGAVIVDLGQLRANWQALSQHVAPSECGAVVKADAYGVGAQQVIPALVAAGCRSFFVATLDEAIAARKLAPGASIFMLDGLLPGTARDVANANVMPVLATLEDIEAWGALADGGGHAPPAALHIDTGLHRLGLSEREVSELQRRPQLTGRFDIALVMSHLACADEAGHPMNREQRATFDRLRAELPTARASLAASDGLMLGRDFHYDLVRPGYALYGGQAAPLRITPVAPVVRVSARILQVQDVPAGGSIGYSASYRATSKRRIATIAAGYADGIFRHASATNEIPGGMVAFAGARVPIVGRVSMDLITVDVSDLNDPAPQKGDWVDLIGPGLPIEAVGSAARTIGYEVLTRLGHRFHRVYLD